MPKKIISIAVALLLAILLLRLTPKPSEKATPEPVKKGTTKVTLTSSQSANSDAAWVSRSRACENIVDEYLKINGRSPTNLISAFLLSKRKDLLDEILKLIPSSKEATLFYCSNRLQGYPGSSRTFTHEEFKDLESKLSTCLAIFPSDAGLMLSLGAIRAKLSNGTDGWKQIAESGYVGKMDLSDRALKQSARAILTLAGESNRNAWVLAEDCVSSYLFGLEGRIRDGIRAYKIERDQAQSSPDNDKLYTLASQALPYFRNLEEISLLRGDPDLSLHKPQRDILQTLEPTAVFGSGQQTVADRIAELDAAMPKLKSYVEATKLKLRNLDDDRLVSFLEMREKVGTIEAVAWLNEK